MFVTTDAPDFTFYNLIIIICFFSREIPYAAIAKMPPSAKPKWIFRLRSLSAMAILRFNASLTSNCLFNQFFCPRIHLRLKRIAPKLSKIILTELYCFACLYEVSLYLPTRICKIQFLCNLHIKNFKIFLFVIFFSRIRIKNLPYPCF